MSEVREKLSRAKWVTLTWEAGTSQATQCHPRIPARCRRLSRLTQGQMLQSYSAMSRRSKKISAPVTDNAGNMLVAAQWTGFVHIRCYKHTLNLASQLETGNSTIWPHIDPNLKCFYLGFSERRKINIFNTRNPMQINSGPKYQEAIKSVRKLCGFTKLQSSGWGAIVCLRHVPLTAVAYFHAQQNAASCCLLSSMHLLWQESSVYLTEKYRRPGMNKKEGAVIVKIGNITLNTALQHVLPWQSSQVEREPPDYPGLCCNIPVRRNWPCFIVHLSESSGEMHQNKHKCRLENQGSEAKDTESQEKCQNEVVFFSVTYKLTILHACV